MSCSDLETNVHVYFAHASFPRIFPWPVQFNSWCVFIVKNKKVSMLTVRFISVYMNETED